ncbi:MAG: ATP-binding protein [Acidovorax sp.]|uniref:ATP-binding protein n=1 Tax=Acidovorax sp. TaxID=1872122 RepID=UPI0022CCBBEC|nr:ATP-binding protein [Acidovorax sp.]MCZ8218182.1 ATP-binding protein [Acidovorax sp.]
MAALRAVRLGTLARRGLPDTLFGRLALLLIVAVIASHVLALTLMFELRPAHPEHPPGPPGMSPPAMAADGRPPPPPGPGPRGERPGFWNAPPALQLGLLLDISVRLAALVAVAWWAARWLSRPMHRLATAAQELGRNIHRPPLPEDGTLECRDASRVFNQMQAHIRQQLAERDRFVAAVSHDLRTPLTRLRLRTESLGDARAQQLFRRDIAEMDAMIASTLDYLRGVAGAEAWVLLDVQALAESMADDQVAMGHRVTVAGQAAPLRVQAVALRRCLDNLVGNAVRYGGSAEVTLHDAADALTIAVRDHGPGLPPEELERVLEPFYRVEASRNRQSGGAGLGLTIASDIVRRHGGQLVLRNAAGGGLVVAARLPRTAA